MYKDKIKSIYYKKPERPDKKKKGGVVRGVYDIETNNVVGKFIVGGLALHNGNESEDTRDNYNITFHNKPYSIFSEIWKHSQMLGGYNKFEIAIHNLTFDIQSLIYNMLEEEKIVYKEPSDYGKQERNTYSIIMNDRQQMYSVTVNYCGINIIFWDTLKLYNASLLELCKVYQLKNSKLEAGEETYNHESFETFCADKISSDYLVNDLLSLAELIDRNYYKKKTASSNAWDNMQKEICSTLSLKKKGDNAIKSIIEFWGDNKLNENLLAGYSGGYCYANPKHCFHTIKNVIHLDINSSYPNAMDKLELPLAHYTSNKIEEKRYIIFCKGEFILKENSFPVIKHPSLMNCYLEKYKGDILLTDIEYERVQKNYDIYNFKILEVMNFPRCEKVLSSFVQKNYEIKQNSTGFLKAKAKLNLNSAYG